MCVCREELHPLPRRPLQHSAPKVPPQVCVLGQPKMAAMAGWFSIVVHRLLFTATHEQPWPRFCLSLCVHLDKRFPDPDANVPSRTEICTKVSCCCCSERWTVCCLKCSVCLVFEWLSCCVKLFLFFLSQVLREKQRSELQTKAMKETSNTRR